MRALATWTVTAALAWPCVARAQSASDSVEVTFTSEDSPLRLLIEERSRLYRLCDAPCALRLPAGTHALYLRKPDREAVAAGRVELWEATHIEGHYESKRAKRIGGGVWLALGTAVGLYFVGAGAANIAGDPDDFFFKEVGIGFLAAGAVVLPVSIVGGSILVSRDDEARIHERP